MTPELDAVCRSNGWNPAAVGGCTHLVTHHREVVPGACYIAVRGQVHDGHEHVAKALVRGAKVIFVEAGFSLPAESGSCFIAVPDTRVVESLLAAPFYRHPSLELFLTGITGTNGKTTTSFACARIERALGRKTAVINTLGLFREYAPVPVPLSHALPPPAALQRLLRELADEGFQSVVMECSSWALAMDRVAGCAFDRVCLTRLTRDHLDMHGTMDAYASAKWQLVRTLDRSPKPQPVLALHKDFPIPGEGVPAGLGTIRFHPESGGGDLRAESVRLCAGGTVFTVVFRNRSLITLRTNLPGLYNVENLLGALATRPELLAAWEAKEFSVGGDFFEDMRVPGRLERVDHPGGAHVFVDYAHTPDALRVVLQTLVRLYGPRVRVVFGCGGDRDRKKRPMMGAVAAELAQSIILTSDNPRSEDPEKIIGEIRRGIPPSCGCVMVEPDRRAAIALALRETVAGDVLLVAGKGHENTQVFADGEHPFDDRVVLWEEMQDKP